MHERGSVSLAVKLSLMMAIFIMLASIMVGLVGMFFYRQEEFTANWQLARSVASATVAGIDGDRFEKIALSLEKDEYWHHLQSFFDEIKTETGILFLYALNTGTESEICYIVDGAKPGDNPEHIRDLGETEELGIYPEEAFVVMETGETSISSIYDSIGYGMMISGMAPITNSAGQVVGVVGADIAVQEVNTKVAGFAFQILGVAVLSSLLGIFFNALYINRRVATPLFHLLGASKRVVVGDKATILNNALARITLNPALMDGDYRRAVNIIATEGCQALSASRVSIWTYDRLRNALINDTVYYLGSASPTTQENFLLDDRPNYLRALETERILVIEDVDKTPLLFDYRAYDNTVNSMVDAPVRIGGELVGAICIEQQYHNRYWTQEEQAFASSLADFTALAIESAKRRKVLDDLNAANQRAESLMFNLPCMVYQSNINGAVRTFGFVSEGGRGLTGHDPKALLGSGSKLFFDMIHPADVADYESYIHRLLTQGTPFDLTFRLLMPDGSIKHVWERSRIAATYEDGSPRALEGFCADIGDHYNGQVAEVAGTAVE